MTKYTYDSSDQILSMEECRISFSYNNDRKVIEIHYSQAENFVISLEYQYDGNDRAKYVYAGMEDGKRNLLRSHSYR